MSRRTNIRPRLLHGNSRKLTVCGFLFLFVICVWHLGPGSQHLPGSHDGFLTAAFHPTLSDQSQSLPPDATPFATRILREMMATIRYALIAMSLAVPAGMVLGFFASTAWWPRGPGRGPLRALLHPLHFLIRLLITLMRSIHELIWALFFLAALGSDPLTACIALALPFAGTLAKVFSEIIDELPSQARDQALSSGTGPIQAFFTTLIPQSFPDMATYTLYRFECALRSSAVLGFIGIETIGLSIQKSFENNFYNELWTELYLLVSVIMLVDILGAALRKRLNTIPSRRAPVPDLAHNDPRFLRALRKSSPRFLLPRVVFLATFASTLLAWFPQLIAIEATPLLRSAETLDRGERITRFIDKMTPQPVREGGTWCDAGTWAAQLWADPGKEALLNTLSIATAAILIAAMAAWIFLPWASRNLANARPFHAFHGNPHWLSSLLWKSCGMITRALFLLSRAIPEYIIAYLLIGLLGISAWPLVLALAIHNFGILGRLWGEVIENQAPHAARHIVQSGGSRIQSYLHSYVPESFNRFILYLFYRWETCVREATILGMLGVVSLGYHIQLARNFSRAYDEMLFYVLLGAAMIFIGDILSFFLRRFLTRS
ncbi:ABC transporter permease subunit [Verrucomicrobiaceae bacterium N1E253]|uniref:ABC transporter permease subunit n=1 Tax=Oceaniferula marina TaxID=2748318 RepID=A0A851GRE0_9BACT|nr:ABC transporter permease subunit [Oceaniferula marina]NWK56774.1 ABC transporter permease subunit [Oceaniferula marina]